MTENDLLLFDRIEVIKKTIEKYGEENFYISFSGGKDSTVLHHLIDEARKNNLIEYVISCVDENGEYFVTKEILEKISNQQSLIW